MLNSKVHKLKIASQVVNSDRILETMNDIEPSYPVPIIFSLSLLDSPIDRFGWECCTHTDCLHII